MKPKTFEEAEALEGIAYTKPENPTALEQWYSTVRTMKFSDLTVEDLCKCLRQGVHVELLIDHALWILGNDINAGELYEGELLKSFQDVATEFWTKNPGEKARLIEIVRKNETTAADEDVKTIVGHLLARMGSDSDD